MEFDDADLNLLVAHPGAATIVSTALAQTIETLRRNGVNLTGKNEMVARIAIAEAIKATAAGFIADPALALGVLGPLPRPAAETPRCEP